MRRIKDSWKITLNGNLYDVYYHVNKENEPISWIQEDVQGFYTKEAAEDYVTKSVMLEKRLYVEARDN
jgi:hypothetical protein